MSFTVYNNSKTNIYMEFKLEQQGIDEDDHAEIERVNEIVNSNFQLQLTETDSGVVNGLSKKKINITFKSTCRFTFRIRLSCNASDHAVKELHASMKKRSQELYQ